MYIERITSHNWLIHRIGNRMLQARLPALNGVVLDIGCGERPFEADILRFADAYYGLDWSNSLHTLSADAIADANRPLPIRTESVKAWIVLRPGFAPSDTLAREIQDFVKVKLAAHEYPRVVQFADALPMTATGKVLRRELRKLG